MPLYMFCPRQQKINLLDFQNQRYIGTFMSQKERERARARAKEKEKEKKKAKRKRERERTKVQAIIFLNCPGQNEKSANYM